MTSQYQHQNELKIQTEDVAMRHKITDYIRLYCKVDIPWLCLAKKTKYLNEPYPLLERSEPPGDQVHHLAGNDAGQHGGRSQFGRVAIYSKTLQVSEKMSQDEARASIYLQMDDFNT